MNILDNARKLRPIIEQAMTSVDDKTASEAADLFPGLKQNGELVKAGTRINWNGTVKKAAVDLWDTAENNPDNAPNLWADLNYRDGIRIIPDVITVTLAFSKDELGWWGDVKYRSLMDANVYTPEQYAAGWEIDTSK
jgi:hypothetical protein